MILPLGSSPQCKNSLGILSGSLHRCRFQQKIFFILFFLRNWKFTSNTVLFPGTDVTQIVNQTGCTVLTLMGITLEKQKRDKTPVSTYQYQSMLALLLRHSLLDKRLINTRPIGHEVSCYGCALVANGWEKMKLSKSVNPSTVKNAASHKFNFLSRTTAPSIMLLCSAPRRRLRNL